MKSNPFLSIIENKLSISDKNIIQTTQGVYSANTFYHDAQKLAVYFRKNCHNNVMTWLNNSYELALCYLAAVLSGTRLTAAYAEPDVNPNAALILHTQTEFLIYDSTLCPETFRAPKTCQTLPVSQLMKTIEPINTTGFQPTTQNKADQFILLSSGTTGTPKCIVYDTQATYETGKAYIEALKLTAKDRVLLARSLNHISGFGEFWGCLISNALIYLQPKLTTTLTIQNLIQFHPTYMGQTLSILSEIANMDSDNADLLSALQNLRMLRSGGSYIPQDVAENIEAHFNLKLNTLYGATECSPMMFNDQTIPNHYTALGIPLSHLETKHLKENGTPCKTNEIGSLWINAPWQFKGYLTDNNTIEAPFIDDWYNTEDLVSMDAQGHYWFHGRANDIITIMTPSYQVNIAPTTFEEALLKHEAHVKMCIAVGVTDANFDQKPVICYTTIDQKPLTESTLRKALKDNINPECMPIAFVHYTHLPKLPNGKVDRKGLKNTMQKQYIA